MNISDTIIAYKIIKDLGRKWNTFKAFELGLIDDQGQKLRSPITAEETASYDSYYKVIFNMKRLLQRFVGKNATVQQITSLFLLREGYSEEQAKMIVESLNLVTDVKKITKLEAKVLIESVVD